jgi:hypothetical protein
MKSTLFCVGLFVAGIFNAIVLAAPDAIEFYPKESMFHRLFIKDSNVKYTRVIPRPTKSTAPPTYLVQYMYHWGVNCSDPIVEPDRTESFAFGACIGGVDADGNMPNTYNTAVLQVTDSEVTFVQSSYSNADCSGNPSFSYTRSQPLDSCDSGGIKYVVVSNDAPWEGANHGIIVKTYPPENSSSETGSCFDYPEVFQSVAFSYCMGVYYPDNLSITNVRYTSCNEHEVTYTMYSDGCETPVKEVSFPTNSCRACPVDPSTKSNDMYCYPQGFWYQNMESISCGAAR